MGELPLIDRLWLLAAAVLVLSMQAGFLLLEAGRVRAKNSVNVAQKNITDLAICWVAFLFVGMTLAYGTQSPLRPDAQASVGILEILYQLGLCSAAATIVSGAVAERMSFPAYMWLAVLLATLLYPLTAWAVWGATYIEGRPSLLADMGFIDFAGGSVVHGVAAWASLAAIIMLGPRAGRFNAEGEPVYLPPSNPVIGMLGTLILLIGWLGFNAGALSPGSPRFEATLIATITAAAFGALAGLLLGRLLDGGIYNPDRTMNGLLGGLVAVTACAGFVDARSAAAIGMVGAVLALTGSEILLRRFKLDDPLDVVAIHGPPGVLGTLAVAAYLPLEQLAGGSRWELLGVQATGAATIAAAVYTATWGYLRLLSWFMRLRVSEDDEYLGLNYTEHGVSISADRLKRALETRKLAPHGSTGLTNAAEDFDDNNELAGAFEALIARHEDANRTIQEQADRFAQFAQTTADFLWETDATLRLTVLGATGASSDSAANAAAQELFERLRPDDTERDSLARCVRRRQALNTFDATLIDDGGVERIVRATGVPYYDRQGLFAGYRGGATDITDQHNAEQRALYLASHDELTGLPNRRALGDRLGQELRAAECASSDLVVAGIDLDGFKAINDAYGHDVGDELLLEVGRRLTDNLRRGDSVYRTGGDEFVATMRGFDPDSTRIDAQRWCERIVALLSEPYSIRGHTLSIGASIGTAEFPEDSVDEEDLVRMADIAMYQAKLGGKGRVVRFLPAMDAEARSRQALEQALFEALNNGEFFVAYQPKIEIANGEILGFEALARWLHPTRGVISPEEFVPALERMQQQHRLGEFMLRDACEFASTWDDQGMHVAVNVTPEHLLREGFVDFVRDTLTATGLRPANLEIELTEESLITDVESTRGVLQQIADMGISIAIDDFGRGNTSLQYLRHFPVHKLKIDKSFIRNLHSDTRARDITRSVVKLGHDLGLTVTAEGVEDRSQLQQLSLWECDEAQGFLFSEPVELDAAQNLLLNGWSAQVEDNDQVA
ncbi:MAG: EAL domain-containing protein [Pseudomonadota bacterium]